MSKSKSAEKHRVPKCPICLDVYKDPKLLMCFHVFCLRCLLQLVDRDRQGRLSLPCPTCRHITPIPAKGVAGLQPLLYVSHQLAVMGEEGGGGRGCEVGKTGNNGIVRAGDEGVKSLDKRAGKPNSSSGGGSANVFPHGNITLCCTLHPGEPLKQFCETCGHLVCSKCCSNEEGHRGHRCKDVLAAARPLMNGPSSSLKEPPVDSVECSIVSDLVGTSAKGNVERRGRGQYWVTYTPTIKGRHQLHIKVEGRHVPGSPFIMPIKSPVENLSTPLRTLGRVQRPWGVALTLKGDMVVAEYSGHKVSILTPRGERKCSFGTSGAEPGQFDHPCEVAVDSTGHILVADSWNHRVQKFSPDGHFVTQAGQRAGEGKAFRCDCPIGIAYNTFNDSIYVVDGTNQVHVLTSDLTYQRSFGGEGNTEGLFNTPWSVACDAAGRVYVADSYNNRIQVFSADGEFLWLFGRRGTGRGELGWPAGITVDAGGMVYVSEGDNCRVSVFSSRGQFVTSFGRKGVGPMGFGAVRGLVVDSSGVVYVCDRDNQFLHMF